VAGTERWRYQDSDVYESDAADKELEYNALVHQCCIHKILEEEKNVKAS
jgi:hypothetical protein